jgi:small subunit ribosomal protein S16
MLKIRMSRIGKKKQPYYRLTLAENTKDTFGKSKEILGSWNPRLKELDAKADRIKYWISQGAQPSPTVNNLLIEKGIIEGKKVTTVKIKKNKTKKTK